MRRSPEDPIHIAIVNYLEAVLPHGWTVHHCANRPRNEKQGALEKARGAKKGWPDLEVWGQVDGAPFVALAEVKAPKGRLSPEQVGMRARLELAGFDYAVWRSIDDARASLRQWMIETKEAGR